MKDSEFITKWVIDTVKEKYPEDVALVVSHTELLIDKSSPAIAYYVPVTERGYELARTFIYKGVGYDIWAIPWERLEGFAALEEYNNTILADGDILYAMNDEWTRRFEALKAEQLANLADEKKSRENALKAYAQAKELYLETLFAGESDSRMLAGYVADYLAQAVAFSRHMYFKGTQTYQLEELESAGAAPEGFGAAYMKILKENDLDKQRDNCREAIILVRGYLEDLYPEEKLTEANIQDLSDWYAELSYTWLRLRSYAALGDNTRAYMWGICLQRELDGVCGDFGIEKPELMSYFRWDDLGAFTQRADDIERMIRAAITSRGGVVREYASEDEFLRHNS